MSAFAETFDIAETHNVRCDKPTGALVGVVHRELNIPPVGRVHLDVYADRAAQQVFTRLYSMHSGEVAWYRTTVSVDGAA